LNILTINVPLIFIVRDIIFFFRGQNIYGAGLCSGQFMGPKRSRPPQKTLRNAPLYVLTQTKKLISRTFKIRDFYFPMCEREIGGERARGRESKGKSESESQSQCQSGKGKETGKGTGKGKGMGKGTRKGKGKERDREYKRAGDFISKPPGPE
jgi:hypothetical protein